MPSGHYQQFTPIHKHEMSQVHSREISAAAYSEEQIFNIHSRKSVNHGLSSKLSKSNKKGQLGKGQEQPTQV